MERVAVNSFRFLVLTYVPEGTIFFLILTVDMSLEVNINALFV